MHSRAERGIESKTENLDERLYYLQQYTRGQPRNLVNSFLHMDPNKTYKEAKMQLEWNFGHSIKISAAYIAR